MTGLCDWNVSLYLYVARVSRRREDADREQVRHGGEASRLEGPGTEGEKLCPVPRDTSACLMSVSIFRSPESTAFASTKPPPSLTST